MNEYHTAKMRQEKQTEKIHFCECSTILKKMLMKKNTKEMSEKTHTNFSSSIPERFAWKRKKNRHIDQTIKWPWYASIFTETKSDLQCFLAKVFILQREFESSIHWRWQMYSAHSEKSFFFNKTHISTSTYGLASKYEIKGFIFENGFFVALVCKMYVLLMVTVHRLYDFAL